MDTENIFFKIMELFSYLFMDFNIGGSNVNQTSPTIFEDNKEIDINEPFYTCIEDAEEITGEIKEGLPILHFTKYVVVSL